MDALSNAPSSSTPLDSAAEPLYLHLSITDPEIARALVDAGAGRARQEFALTALRIGILSLKAARGTVDGETVRSEGERLLVTLDERLSSHRQVLDEALGGTLRAYFDPASGSFTERVGRLLRQGGELATLITRQVDTARQSLDAVFQQHMGEQSELRRLLSPEQGNELLQPLHAQVRQALHRQGEAITGEFTLDRPESALSRLARELKERHGDLDRNLGEKVASVVGEFSLDDENSALSRLVGRVKSAQGQIAGLEEIQTSARTIVSGREKILKRADTMCHEIERRLTSLHGAVAGMRAK